MKWSRVLSVAVVLALWAAPQGGAWAQQAGPLEEEPLEDEEELEPMVTDRPDVTESPNTVAPGHFQAEMGADVSAATDGGESVTLTLPTKLRLGLTEDIEAFVASSIFQAPLSGDGDLHAASFDVGGKVTFREKSPALGLLFAVTIPTGPSEAVVLGPTLAAAIKLTKRLGLGLNLGASIPVTEREVTDDELKGSAALGISITKSLGIFVELFGTFGLGAGEGMLGADTGTTLMLGDDIQLDAYFRTLGLTDGVTQVVGGLGVSVRL